jgi:hypothetical protein
MPIAKIWKPKPLAIRATTRQLNRLAVRLRSNRPHVEREFIAAIARRPDISLVESTGRGVFVPNPRINSAFQRPAPDQHWLIYKCSPAEGTIAAFFLTLQALSNSTWRWYTSLSLAWSQTSWKAFMKWWLTSTALLVWSFARSVQQRAA